MRLLLAINHLQMQQYLARIGRAEITAVAESTDELIEMLNYIKADILILSRDLKGKADSTQVVERLSELRRDIRVIYLYGQKDADTEDFLRFLSQKGIYDCHIGLNISNVELNHLLFGRMKKKYGFFGSMIKRDTDTKWIKSIDTAVFAVYSNSSNGKSHFAWNLAAAMDKRGYRTTLINIDKGYSANLYFGIDEIYHELLDYMISQNRHKDILDSCYQKGNSKIVSGRLGMENSIETEDFLKLFYFIKAKSDIVILDTYTGINENTMQAINNSNVDFLIFDCDLMHFHMNKLMLERLGSHFIGSKTIAIINNCHAASEGYKFIYRQVNKLKLGFKEVLPLSSCGSQGCDLMSTGKTPYSVGLSQKSSFSEDFDRILRSLNIRETAQAMQIMGGRQSVYKEVK